MGRAVWPFELQDSLLRQFVIQTDSETGHVVGVRLSRRDYGVTPMVDDGEQRLL